MDTVKSVKQLAQLSEDLAADRSFDNARQQASDIFDYLRRLGPFEPARLPPEEMEYTTMPDDAKRLIER